MKYLVASLLIIVSCHGQTTSADDRTRLDALQEQLTDLYRAGKYTEGLKVAQAILALVEKALGPEHPDTATALGNVAGLYATQGQDGKAEPLYQRSLAIREKALGPEDPATAESLHHLAELYRAQGQYAKAEPLYTRALAIMETAHGPEHPLTAAAVLNLAGLYKSQGQYAKAEPLYRQALSVFEKALGPEDETTATAVNNLAGLYTLQGQYAKAEPLFQRALAIREKALGPAHPSTAGALISLAETYRLDGQYTKAEPLYQRALAVFEKVLGPEHPDTATALNNLAGLYQSQGRYAKAEGLFQRALAIREKALGPVHPSTGESLNNLAALYQSEDQYAKAEPLYQRALAIREKALGPAHPSTGESLNNLATLYTLQGQYAKAEPLYQRALAIAEARGAERPNTASSLNNLAELYRSQGQYAKAEPLHQRALAIREKALGPEHPATAESLDNLASLWAAQDQYASAEPLYKRALAIRQKALGPEHPATAVSRDNLTLLQWDAGDPTGAQRTLAAGWRDRLQWLENSLRFGTEASRRNYVAGFRAGFSMLIAMQGADTHVHELGLQAALVSKARVLQETAAAMEALRRRADPDLREKLDDLNAARAKKGVLLNVPTSSRSGDLRSRIEALNEQEERLTAELTARSFEFRELTTTPNIQELRNKLGQAALVEVVEFSELYQRKRHDQHWGPPRYGAYVLTGAGDVQWRDFGPAAGIDVLVRRYSKAMTVPGNQSVAHEAARQLDELVFAPIRRALPQVKEFYVSSDGLLRLIPFGALIDDGGKLLIENYSIQTLSTGRDLVRGAPVHSVQPAWVGGLAEFGQRGEGLFFPAIPGAKEEARAVAKIIRPQPHELNDGELTKQFLMQKMDGPRILHLATHGYYFGQTGGLALKDANSGSEHILNQEEAAGLRLQGTQLVVLSACETALGEVSYADGVIGLQRSLTLSGARSQILTLWPVSDGETKHLMVAFYRNLFEKKMTKSEALRQAQLELVHQGVDPYYWAPFVLYGDGGPLGE